MRLALLLVIALPVAARAQPDPGGQAREQFARGKMLYRQGRYRQALEAFERAQRAKPHPDVLFSIARCHDSLNDFSKALDAYHRALKAATDPAVHDRIQERIDYLSALPVKVFVSTQPTGAAIHVDGRKRPAPARTPTALQLVPGVHLLVLRLDGYRPTVLRVEVAVGKDQTRHVPLQPEPRCPASQPAACPACRCPEPLRLDSEKIMFSMRLMAGFGWGTFRPITVGGGVMAHGIYRRFIFGGTFLAHAASTTSIPEVTTTDAVYDASKLGWYLFHAQGGYMVPFGPAYFHGTLGVGLSYERGLFGGYEYKDQKQGPKTSTVFEKVAFSWGAAGGVEAMVLRWLSVGFVVHLGMIIGDRPDLAQPTLADEQKVVLFGTASAAATIHIW
jgi:hypothetical protein